MPDPRSSTLNRALVRASEDPDAGLRLIDRREQAHWLSWFEVYQQARVVAGGLRAVGIQKGDVVGLVFPTGTEFFAAFFGVTLAGGGPGADGGSRASRTSG